jgi:hypothetical protein
MKRSLVLVVALVATGIVATAGSAAPRIGGLHVTKECSQYNGAANSFCTITASNLSEIGAGSRVVYLQAAGADGLDTDLRVDAGPGNAAFGHVTLSFATLTGSIIFTGGTGSLEGFSGRVSVRLDKRTGLWHWDGMYRFGDA